jgi:hypothetical protein
LINEASRVFAALARGLSIEAVRVEVLRGTLLSQRSSENRERIWRSVKQRYLIPTAPWLTSLLADTGRSGPHSREFVSLLYLLYALRDRLAFDFVTDVLWAKGHEARPVISRNEVLDFLTQAAGRQPQIERWTESTRIKLAGSILTALRDFGVLEGQQKKVLARPILPLSTAEALLRVLIVEGCRGRQAVQDSTWRLFLLTEQEVTSTDHRFLTDREWKRADELCTELAICSLQPSRAPVLAIREHEVPSGLTVYNFEVERTHNYCVGVPGLVAHNFK